MSLIANFNFLASGSKDKRKELKQRGFTEQQIEASLPTGEGKEISLNIVFKNGFESFKCDEISYLLETHSAFEKSMLPFAGSFSEQPAKVIEVFQLISALKQERDDRARKEQERKQRK